MLIGAMNHPEREISREIEWMAGIGLDFIDLTLEAPATSSWKIDPQPVRALLGRYGLGVVGHTPWYLPLASAVEELRQAALAELRRCLEVFSALGARWMNLHADRYTPSHGRSYCIERNVQSLRDLLPDSQRLGVGLMIENLPGEFNDAAQLGEILDRVPEVGLHLDVGHANLQVARNTTPEILAAHGRRLRHVHLHDNRGGNADLHLPLGAGDLDVRRQVRALQDAGYDGTITLEVFTPDTHYLAYSRSVLRRIWSEVAEEREREGRSARALAEKRV